MIALCAALRGQNEAFVDWVQILGTAYQVCLLAFTYNDYLYCTIFTRSGPSSAKLYGMLGNFCMQILAISVAVSHE